MAGTTIDEVTTSKINISDIIDNLTSTDTGKPLSAKQGKVLKDLLTDLAGKIPTKTSQLANDSGYITGADVPEGAAASATVPKMDGTAAAGTETAFARGAQTRYI